MKIINEIPICFNPEGYANRKMEEDGIVCKNKFSRNRKDEIILDIELKTDDIVTNEKTMDLQLCFTITEDMMPIGPIQYCYPAREFVLSRDHCAYDCAYGYRFPLSFVTASYNNMGITLIFDDQKQSRVGILKQNDRFQITVQYKDMPLEQTDRKVRIIFHDGDWHQGFYRYKSWYRNKYDEDERLDKRLSNCYHIRRYFFNSQFCSKAIYDGKDYKLMDQYKDDQIQAGGVDLALLFDYAYTAKDNIRCGNAEPFANLVNLEDLNQQIQACKKEGEFTVYAYFDPYLIQDGSDFDKSYREALAVFNKKGKRHHVWGNQQWHPCLSTDEWRNESLSYLEKVREELEVDGFYLDEIGNGEQFVCHNETHNHLVPLNQNDTENHYVNLLKERFPEKLFMCEFFPADSNIGLFSSVLSDSKTVVDISRFAFPYKKIFKIIDCDRPIGDNSWDIKKIFFNGMGLWLDNDLHDQEWYSSNVKNLIKKHYKILKRYNHIFESQDIEPLVEINSDFILANRFTKKDETIFTFINVGMEKANCHFMLRGKDPIAYDVYNDRACECLQENAMATIKIELQAHEVACVYVIDRYIL